MKTITASLTLCFAAIIQILTSIVCAAPGDKDAVTLADNRTLQVVDGNGKPISASNIPAKLLSRLRTIRLDKSDNPADNDVGLVVAKVNLPKNEKVIDFHSSLVRRNNGTVGKPYLNFHESTHADADVICIGTNVKYLATHLEIRKLNYKPIDIPIPNINPTDKLIWLGEVALNPLGISYTDAERHTVTGKVIIAGSGDPLNRGEASIRINGTAETKKVPIQDGKFSFDGIPSGKYLVEFVIDGYAVARWRLTLEDGKLPDEKTLTAFPRHTFTLKVNNLTVDVTAGIPYHDNQLRLPNGLNVSVNQEGDRIYVYSTEYFINVPGKTNNPGPTWNGSLGKGDLIQVLNRKSGALVYSVDCINVSSYEVAANAKKPDKESKQMEPIAAPPIVNSIGMKFVSVPGTNVLFCIHDTRKSDYRKYSEANHKLTAPWDKTAVKGIPICQGEDNPVVMVNWHEAKEFCAWLTKLEKKEGRKYRLPTDHEWSIAVGIGDQEDQNASPESKSGKIKGVYPWGTQWPPPAGTGNFEDVTLKKTLPFWYSRPIEGYNDGFATTSPVMSFQPNKFGLYDMSGNVLQWCEDKYSSQKPYRVLRGSAFDRGESHQLLSSYRAGDRFPPEGRNYETGFRVVLEQ